jgi:hypothetical protein
MKKIYKVSALAATVLSLAVSAQAATDYSVNLVGASAQGTFWNSTREVWLKDVNGMNCASVVKYGSKDNGAAVGTSCTPHASTGVTLAAGDRLIMRYRAQASIFGPKAVNGETIASASNKDDSTSAACGAGQYALIDVNTAPASSAAATGYNKCYDITFGASDVSGEAFVQSSVGYKYGPTSNLVDYIGGGDPLDSYYDDGENAYAGYDTSNLGNVRPVVVPFSFFVSDDVMNMDGDTDVTNDSLTQLQAVLALSGQATTWEDMGIDADNNPATDTKLTLCMRHAGSGTHATMDHTVLHGDKPSVKNEDIDGANGAIVWFNEGSSDVTACMTYGGPAYSKGTTVDGQWPTASSYALGYADSDKCGFEKTKALALAAGHTWSSSCNANGGTGLQVRRINYQGVEGNRDNIKNCRYPFFAEQYLYYNPNTLNPVNGSGNRDKIHANLNTWMSTPANLSNAVMGASATQPTFWATQQEMKCTKTTDFELAHKK